MGVLRWTSVCALLGLAAASGLAGCRNDKGDEDGIAGKTGPLGPIDPSQKTKPGDPGSPGLEPPDHGPDDMAGSAQGGSNAPITSPPAGEPTMTPASPGASAGSGGFGNSAGSGASVGAGGAGGAGAQPDAGTHGDAGADDLCSATECSIEQPCEDPALHCIALRACAHPVCVAPADACQAVCGTEQCAVLESYPEQIACD